MRVLLALALVLLLTPSPVQAEVEVRASLDRARIEPGRSLTLVVEVRVPDGAAFTPPEAEALDLAPFEVRDAVRVPLAPEQGWRRWRYTLRLSAYEPGRLQIPPLRFGASRSQPLAVEVAPVRSAPKGRIREVHPPLGPRGGLAFALAAALGLGCAVLLAWAAGLLLRRFARRGPETPGAAALRELEALSGPADARLAALGDILRAWVERRHQVPARRRTTSELLADLAERGLALPGLQPLLQEADLAKFARHRPDEARLAALLREARSLVEEGAPR